MQLKVFKIKPVTGIYFLYKNKKLIYIGMSIDIHRRVSNHPHKFDAIKYINCPKFNYWQLKILEDSLITKYKPKLNKTHKGF